MKKIIIIFIVAVVLISAASCGQESKNPGIEIADTTEPTSSVLFWVEKASSVMEALPEESKNEKDTKNELDEQKTDNPFEGDWVGVIQFSGCAGQLAGNEGLKCDIVARFVTNQDGSMKAFLAIPVQTDMNFKDISVSYTQDTKTLLLNAVLLNTPCNGSAVVGLDDQQRASFSMVFQNDAGDQASIQVVMRQAGKSWTDEDTNIPSEGTLNTFNSLGIYSVAEGFSANTSLIPEWE